MNTFPFFNRKRRGGDSHIAVEAMSKKVRPDIAAVLQPFRDQSIALESVIAVGTFDSRHSGYYNLIQRFNY